MEQPWRAPSAGAEVGVGTACGSHVEASPGGRVGGYAVIRRVAIIDALIDIVTGGTYGLLRRANRIVVAVCVLYALVN